VEPADVKWVFLSHDDVDHNRNLEQVLTACPNATLGRLGYYRTAHQRVTSRSTLPLDQRRRKLRRGRSHAHRHPSARSTTRRRRSGLLDEKTACTGRSTPSRPMMGAPMSNVSEIDPDSGPGHGDVHVTTPFTVAQHRRPGEVRRDVCPRAGVGAKTIVTAHSPIITADMSDKAFESCAPAVGRRAAVAESRCC